MIFMASQTPLPPPAGPVIRPSDDDGGSVVAERKLQKTKPPQMYQVVMLNDDYTPMDFVVVVIWTEKASAASIPVTSRPRRSSRSRRPPARPGTPCSV
jgi:hypothetical protein